MTGGLACAVYRGKLGAPPCAIKHRKLDSCRTASRRPLPGAPAPLVAAAVAADIPPAARRRTPFQIKLDREPRWGLPSRANVSYSRICKFFSKFDTPTPYRYMANRMYGLPIGPQGHSSANQSCDLAYAI